MKVGLSLLLYGVAIAASGRFALRLHGRASRAPALGVLTWQLLTWSAVVAWLGGGLALAQLAVPFAGLDRLLTDCWTALHPGAAPLSTNRTVRLVGFVIVGLVVGRVLWSAGRTCVSTWNRRRRHLDAVRLVGRRAVGVPALVLDHEVPAAYCVPGRVGQIVISSGALAALTEEQLGAVLAHERAHLSARHDLPLLWARALERAFPRMELFRTAAREIGVLVEMCADDAAARRWGPAAVTSALRSLSPVPCPSGGLGASSVGARERIDRLEDRRAAPATRVPLILIAAALAAGPMLAAAAPMLAEVLHHLTLCPLPVT